MEVFQLFDREISLAHQTEPILGLVPTSLLLECLIDQDLISKAEWIGRVSTDVGETQDFVFWHALDDSF